MKNLGILFCLFQGIYGSGVRTPSIRIESVDQEVDVGSSAELECSVQYPYDFSILWIKKGTNGIPDLPISSDSALIIRDSRYSLRHDAGSSTYTLQIKDLQQYDGGEYMCQVIIDITNRISKSVRLGVRQPPIIFDNFTRTVIVTRGTPVKLECYATGVPKPKISWRRENNALLPTGGSVFSGRQLLIPSIRKEDRGTYYCIADNGVGKGARKNINVEVEFEPTVTALKSVVEQAQTFDARLECSVEAYPPADISWIFRSESLVSNRKYGISQFPAEDDLTDSVIAISSVEDRNYGVYTCRAHNRLGHASTEIELRESYYPVCPPACGDGSYTYGSAASAISSIITLVLQTIILMV